MRLGLRTMVMFGLAAVLCAPSARAQQPRAPSDVSTSPPMPQAPTIESLPAAESPAPYYSPSLDASSDLLADPEPNDGTSEPPYEEPYMPRGRQLPSRVRSYIENRPRQPQLQTESWLNRPYSASFLLGGVFLDNPTTDIDGDAGLWYGGRIGWDFSPRVGIEARLGAGSAGISSNLFTYDLPKANLLFADLNWLWYPTGDTRWRPYLSAGTGMFNIDFNDATNHRYHESLLSLPFGIGLKYRYSTRTVMRFEFIDEFALGSGHLNSMHNLTISAGLETRFGGGSRRNYWPWNPGRDWK